MMKNLLKKAFKSPFVKNVALASSLLFVSGVTFAADASGYTIPPEAKSAFTKLGAAVVAFVAAGWVLMSISTVSMGGLKIFKKVVGRST